MFAIRSNQHRVRGAVCTVVVVGMSSGWASGAVIHTKAVRVNEEPVTPTSYVLVNPGDRVDLEFYASGWSGEISAVKTFQITVDQVRYFSGDQGQIMPVGWDAPFLGRPCQADKECGGGVCGTSQVCESAHCLTDADCAEPFVCHDLVNSQVCRGLNHEPEPGAFIELDNPEFIFAGFSNVISAVATWTLRYRFGATLFLEDGPVDDGGTYYLCTLMLVVSEDARGVFTIGAANSPDSFLTDPRRVDAPLVLKPVTIEVGSAGAAEIGACCKGLHGCEDVIESACTQHGGFWQRGQACGVGKQSCVTARPARTRAN